MPESNNNPFFLLEIWDKVLSALGMSGDSDKEKNRVLKEIKKNLKKNYKKYVKVGANLLEPAFPKIFYEFYTVVGPAQTLLANAATSGALKTLVIELNLTDRQRQLEDTFQEAAIRARANQIPIGDLTEELKKALIEFVGSFDAEITKKIDSLYNQLLVFLEFISYKYYFLLKKFDAGLPERDFNYLPRWEAISGEYIVEDLKEFMEVIQGISAVTGWDEVLNALKEYRNVDVVNRDAWKKALTNLLGLKKSGLLQNIIMYFGREPDYKPLSTPPSERIVESYVTMVRTQTELILTKIVKERKSQKVQQLVKQVFGTDAVSRTKNYTEKANLTFGKKMMGGYLYIEPVNYLKAFLMDTYKRDIRELANMLLVKGQWYSPPLSQPFSESFYYLMEMADKLIAWDDSLAEDSDKGMKLKNYMMRFDRDANARVSLNQMLKDINGQAKQFLTDAVNHLVVIGKVLKQGVEDLAKPKHDLITNWKTLENSTDKNLREWMAELYKNLYYFVQLMQYFIKESGD